MLLSFTLNTTDDGVDEARTAIALIADLFNLPVTIGTVNPPGDLGTATTPAPGSYFAAANAAATAVGLNLAGVPLDADGLPHDSRIHASTQTKNADGRWKAKPKIDATERARVEAELRSIMGTGPALPPPGAPPPPAAGAAPPPPPAAPAPPPPAAPAAAPPPPPVAAVAPPAPPPAPAATPGAPTSFVGLMQWVMPYMHSGQLSAERVSDALLAVGCVNAAGVGELSLLASREDLVGRAYDELCARIPRE